MNLSNSSPEPNPVPRELQATEPPESEPNRSMQEFYQLRQQLLVWTFAITVMIFIAVWICYSLKIALNYLLGAIVGVVYLRMLARDVERIGKQQQKLVPNRLALFIGLIIVATQWNQLELMPVFLGFLTYKATLIVYMLRTTILPESK